MIEDLIWLVLPFVAGIFFAAIARFFTIKTMPLKNIIIVSIFSSLVGWGLGPRCMCSDMINLVIGSVLFSFILGLIFQILSLYLYQLCIKSQTR